jgi:manganese/iron transport system ATP-binding protein
MALIKEIEKTNKAIRRDHAQHDTSAPILKVTGVSVAYEAGYALRDMSFELPRAMRLAVVGPNGAGKSTLLKVIGGVINPSQGKVEVFGEDPGSHICIAYVPQRSQVDWSFPVSVRDVVMMGRIGKQGLLRRPGRLDWEAVENALEVVNLSELSKRQIGELSGGQQQRMFIARALSQEAELMLMDEPLTGLDIRSQEGILAILDTLRQQRVTVLVALHDLKMAAEQFDAVMLLNRHLIGFGLPETVFSTNNLIAAYGIHRVSESAGWLAVDEACCGDGHHNHD